MSAHRIPWPAIAWQPGNHPLEQKKVAPGPCTLLRFAPGFADPNPCQRSHVLHVLEGVLTVALREGEVRCGPGESFVLSPGTSHQVRNDTDGAVVLLAVSDVTWPGAER